MKRALKQLANGFKYIIFEAQPISMNSSDQREYYMLSHGKKTADGRCYTYKELQSSLFSKIGNCLYFTVLLVILAICIGMIIIIDVKKGTEKDVVEVIANISQGSIQVIYNKTVEVGGSVANSLIETVVVNAEKGKEWVSEGLEDAYQKVAENSEVSGVLNWVKNTTVWQKANEIISGTPKEVIIQTQKTQTVNNQTTQSSAGATTTHTKTIEITTTTVQ